MATNTYESKNINNLGRVGLIEHLTKNIKIRNKQTVLGPGDDAAAIDSSGDLVVSSADLLLEGIHFDMMYTPLKHLGYKAAVIGISDVLAMNAYPTQLLISVGISKKIGLNHLDELYEGINLACEKYQVDFAGGDTTSSLTGLTINVTALGTVSSEKMVTRKGADVNEIVCVTGDFGGAYMGLQLLEREKKVFESSKGAQPDLSGYEYILERQLKPEARKDVIRFLEKAEVLPTAMIDVSDGLASDLLHICHSSGLGCKIFQEKIPIHKNTEKMADTFDIEPLTAALNGGRDYELLFTISTEDYEKLKDEEEIIPIGHMTSQEFGCYMITTSDHEVELRSPGWEGFKKENKS